MAEINVQVRQARQHQAAQVQLHANLLSVIGKHLRGLASPARENTLLSLIAVLKAACVDLSLARTNVALVFATPRKRPGIQLLLQGVERLFEPVQFCVGTGPQAPDPLSGLLRTLVWVQPSEFFEPWVTAVKCAITGAFHQVR